MKAVTKTGALALAARVTDHIAMLLIVCQGRAVELLYTGLMLHVPKGARRGLGTACLTTFLRPRSMWGERLHLVPPEHGITKTQLLQE